MSLNPQEEQELQGLLEVDGAVEPFEAYIRRVVPDLPPPPHLAPLRRLIEDTRRREVRALVSLPPGFAKSTTLNLAAAWLSEVDPANLNVTASYASALALHNSRTARRLFRESGRVRLSNEKAGAELWHTEHGGGLKAVGVDGSLTGTRVTGCMFMDDLIKGRNEAESVTVRESTWAWFKADAYTRLTKGASCIVVSTRWHLDDVHGRILRSELADDWEVINLPAISDDRWVELGDGTRTMLGESLWPEEYPVDKLVEIRLTIGEYDWSSLFMGQPRPRGDRIFYEPARFDLREFVFDQHRACNALDPAATAKAKADYSALGTFAMRGMGTESRMWVLSMRRWQVQIPKLVQLTLQHQRDHRFGRGLHTVVEAVGGFKAVPQMLKDQDPSLRLYEIQPKGDKHVRAQPLAAAWNDGRVMVPAQGTADWDVDAYIQELQEFTGVGDVHDDQVDTTAHAWTALYRQAPQVRGARPSYGPFG